MKQRELEWNVYSVVIKGGRITSKSTAKLGRGRPWKEQKEGTCYAVRYNKPTVIKNAWRFRERDVSTLLASSPRRRLSPAAPGGLRMQKRICTGDCNIHAFSLVQIKGSFMRGATRRGVINPWQSRVREGVWATERNREGGAARRTM